MSITDSEKITKRILVTGGGGFLGGALVRRLVEEGHQVRSFSRKDYPELRELGVETLQGDIRDFKAVLEACQGCDVVFHVAAKVGIWGPSEEFYSVNVEGTKNVIEACQKTHVHCLIYTSSPSVVFDGLDLEGVDESIPYPETYLSDYPRTKAEAELLVKKASNKRLKTAILRPHLIWGPGDTNLVARIIERADSLRIIGKGNNLIDVLYIDNAVDAHIQLADALAQTAEISGRAYFISQGKPVNAWKMINDILQAAGKKPISKSIPYGLAYIIGALLEFFYKLLRIKKEPPLTRFVVTELAKSHWFNIEAARRDFGYSPKISTEEGLQRLQKWLQTTPRLTEHRNNSSS